MVRRFGGLFVIRGVESVLQFYMPFLQRWQSTAEMIPFSTESHCALALSIQLAHPKD
jgi:hypothetical protein